MIKVIEMSGKDIPADVYGVAYSCGIRLQASARSVSVMDYGTSNIVAKKQGNSAVVIVTLQNTGIIIRPRSGIVEQTPYTEYIRGDPETRFIPGVKGGWRDGVTELSTKYPFPLVDDDDAAFIVSVDEDGNQSGDFASDSGAYGNLYWTDGNVTDPVILSWRGTPTRHFRLPSKIDIPGFSMFETSVPGTFEDKPEYTAFGTKLYQGGEVVAEAPHYSWPYNDSSVQGRCLILGAMQGADGTTYIVTQNDHKLAPSHIWLYSDGTKREGSTETYLTEVNGTNPPPNPLVTILVTKELTKPGFFLGLWQSKAVEGLLRIDGWTLISERVYARNGLPWFGNVSGTAFVCSNGDKLDTTGSLTPKQPTVGLYRETGEQCLTTFASNFSGAAYFEFAGDAALNAVITHSFLASTTYSNVEDQYKHMGTSWPEKVALDSPLLSMMITRIDSSTFRIIGGMAPYTTNIGSVAGDILDVTGQCGTKIVVITDSCGLTNTSSQRMPLGYKSFVFANCSPAAGCSPAGAWPYCDGYGSTCSGNYYKMDCTGIYDVNADADYWGQVYMKNSGSCPDTAHGCVGCQYSSVYNIVWVCP